MEKIIKAAIIGCGVISHTYMDVLNNKLTAIEVVACSDLDIKRMEEFALKYAIKALPFDEVLKDQEIEMVINLTTPNAHYSLSKQALLHDKHVFSEKTISVELDEGKELCGLAKERGLRLGAAPDTFLGASVQTAKYILDTGLIGKPLSFVASISKDYGIFGDILPHLWKKGAGILFDVGCYYITALASIFGPVCKIQSFTSCHQPQRKNMRITSNDFAKPYAIEVDNLIASTIQFHNGVIGTFHLNSDSIWDESSKMEVYGTDGILYMGDPNVTGSPVSIQKSHGIVAEFPFTHGFSEQSRGIGAVEMAWSIKSGRQHRASMELAYHVLEVLHGILISAENETTYVVKSTFKLPPALPTGYIGSGFWEPTEESALV